VKVLWVSNSPNWNSGYGSQTRQVGRRLLRAGYELEFSTNDGTRGDAEWEGCRVRGSGRDRYSRDTVREDINRSRADQVIVLFDAWPYAEQDPFKGLPNVTGWCPVDHLPVPPQSAAWMRQHRTIAMSRFGEAMLRQPGDIDLRYAPHGIEPVFHPTPVAAEFGRPFREATQVPADAFLVGIVAANIGSGIYDRKGFGDMFQALSVFMHEHRDAWLYVHTQMQGYEGIPLEILASVTGLPPERVRFADQYALAKQAVSDEMMASIYTSFDVLLATSRGEGFGLPVIEAQACGVPVIVSNWTAQPELVGEPFDPQRPGAERRASGWLVSVDPDYDPRQAAFFAKPSVREIAAALDDAYLHRGDESMRAAALAKAAEYDADRVFETYWRPILAELEHGPAKVIPLNRQQRRAAQRRSA
jgi:glycosyltransferase involved in cell wall biosynthesis